MLRCALLTFGARGVDAAGVSLSPFSSPRVLPRRPVGLDMRRITGQACLIFAGIPGGVALMGLATDSPGSFAFGFWTGLLMAALAMAAGWLRSMVFESKHLDESAAFWVRQEAKVRPRMFATCALITALGVVGLAVARVSSSAPVAGFWIAPTFVAGSVVVLMWGNVP